MRRTLKRSCRIWKDKLRRTAGEPWREKEGEGGGEERGGREGREGGMGVGGGRRGRRERGEEGDTNLEDYLLCDL